MAGVKESEANRALGAEVILISAIAVVLVLVAVLGGVLISADSAHRTEAEVVDRVRAARSEMMAATQAQSDAEAIASRYAATSSRALLPELEAAEAEAQERLAALRLLITDDAEAIRIVDRIEAIIHQRLEAFQQDTARPRDAVAPQRPGSALYTAFRAETATFHRHMNGRIDEARAAQQAARNQLNTVAATLAFLSLLASALAIYALRREREQWRLAQAVAEDARAKAAAADTAKSRFLAVASHDMRQPLHALTLYLSALERRVETAEARDIIGKMERATQSMIGMFSMLLDLARVQAGVITPEISTAALNPIFDRVAAGQASGEVEITPSALSVKTDPVLLERVLANLVSNAVKHGGGKARVSASEDGAFARIEVADDGPGVAPEDHERIFAEFVRLKPQNDGLGLGLVIVQRIAEMLGTKVTVDSAPGHGARFSIRIPTAQEQAEPQTGWEGEESILVGVPVLVVDDDPLAREAAASTLRDLGAEVTTCANESELSTLLSQGLQPRLLLMDLRIDDELQGIDIATRALAKLQPPPPVIVVTGDTAADTLAMLRTSGFAWLIKPVNKRALARAAGAELRTQRRRAIAT